MNVLNNFQKIDENHDFIYDEENHDTYYKVSYYYAPHITINDDLEFHITFYVYITKDNKQSQKD